MKIGTIIGILYIILGFPIAIKGATVPVAFFLTNAFVWIFGLGEPFHTWLKFRFPYVFNPALHFFPENITMLFLTPIIIGAALAFVINRMRG